MPQTWKLIIGGFMVALAAAGLTAVLLPNLEKPREMSQAAQAGDTKATDVSVLYDMKLEKQFHGPLKDTVIQRWKDPEGTVCFVYLPIAVQHSPPTPTGFVQYGPNGIGSISCINR